MPIQKLIISGKMLTTKCDEVVLRYVHTCFEHYICLPNFSFQSIRLGANRDKRYGRMRCDYPFQLCRIDIESAITKDTSFLTMLGTITGY